MTSPTHLSRVLWIALTLVAAPKLAVAQDQGRFEVAGGYSFMEDYDGDMTFPRGWFGSLAADITGPFAVVGEASGSYKSMSIAFGEMEPDASASSHTFMGGPRLQWRTSRVAPYAQMLFGVSRLASSIDLPDETLTVSQNNFVMAPGGGIDVSFSDRASFRTGASVRMIRADRFQSGSERYTFYEFQVIAGIAFR